MLAAVMSTTARWMTVAMAAMLLATACGKGSGGGPGGGGAGGESGDTSDTAGGFQCGTCAQVFVNGGVVCDGTKSSDVYTTLLHCACDACVAQCSDTLCAGLPSNSTCGECLVASCNDEEMACAAN
jgi:hypothetical protein